MVITSAYFINFRWHEFLGFCGSNHVIRIRKSMFVWMLNVSVYFINCCWGEFQGFCGNNHLWHLWANYHIDASCVMTSSKPGNFGFTSIYLIIFLWHEFLVLGGTNHIIYEPIITWMLISYWRLQNRDISLCLNVNCLCLIHELLLTWNSKQQIWSNHIWAYNEVDSYFAMTSSKQGSLIASI